MSLQTQSSLQVAVTLTGGIADIPIRKSYARTLANGTASTQADLTHVARYSVGTGGTTLDLSGGSLVQPDTSAASFVKVKEIMVYNADATASVTVGGGTNAFTGLSGVAGPGGILYRREDIAPMTVTNSTADLLRLVSSAGTISVDVIIVGTSA